MARPVSPRRSDKHPPGPGNLFARALAVAACADRDVERRAATGHTLALDPDRSAHRLGERARDREPEPGAGRAARARHVELRERLEQLAAPLERDADAGVAYGEAQLEESLALRR